MPSIGQRLADGAAGKRDRYVEIYGVSTATATTSGMPSETWTCISSAWMSRTDLSGQERFSSDQELASAQTRWTMLYDPCLDPELIDVAHKRRLKYRERYYDILSAEPIGWRQQIDLITLARTG